MFVILPEFWVNPGYPSSYARSKLAKRVSLVSYGRWSFTHCVCCVTRSPHSRLALCGRRDDGRLDVVSELRVAARAKDLDVSHNIYLGDGDAL